MKIFFSIMKTIALYSLNWVYDYIDEDKDGVIEKNEIKDFTDKICKLVKGGLKNGRKN